mgnify:CR=1 FL=1
MKCICGGTYIEQTTNLYGRKVLKCDGKCKTVYMKCTCGEWIRQGSGYFKTDYKCECGNEFTSNGGKLAPRNQWGEETGEVFT